MHWVLAVLVAWLIFMPGTQHQAYMVAGWLALAVPWVWPGGARPRTMLDGAWAVLGVTTVIGALSAYDPGNAWRQAGLFAVALSAFYALVAWARGPRQLTQVGWALSLSAAGAAVYFVTQRDWTLADEKFAFASAFGRWVNASVPRLGFAVPHPNIVATGLSLGLIAGLGLWPLTQGRARGVLAGALACIVGGLVLSGSRGSMGALAATAALWSVWRVMRAWRPQWTRVALVGLGGLAGLALIAVLAQGVDTTLAALFGAQDKGAIRATIWENSVPLVRDYIYTGAGINTFPLVYAAYAQVTDAPLVPHAHNLYLALALGQGVSATLALVFALGVTAWRAWCIGPPAHPVARAGLWGVVAFALMGLVDAIGYADRAAPILFVPLGLAYAGWASAGRPARTGHGLTLALAAWLVGGVWVLAGDPWSALFANAGALQQTRIELAAYCARVACPHAPTEVDRFRPAVFEDLRVTQSAWPEIAQAQANLVWAGDALGARTRRVALALAGGRADAVGALLTPQAYTRAARLAYADAQLAHPEEALGAVRGVPEAAGYFATAARYRYWARRDWARVEAAFFVALALAPERTDWAVWRDEARRAAGER